MSLSRVSVLICLLFVCPLIADEGDLQPTPMREVIPAAAPAQPERLPSLASRPTPATPSGYETTILGPDEVIEGDVIVNEPSSVTPAPRIADEPPVIVPHYKTVPQGPAAPQVQFAPHVQYVPAQVVVERVELRPHFPLLQPQPIVTVSKTYTVEPCARETTVVTRKAVKTYVPAKLSTVEVEVDPGFVPGQPLRNLIRAHRAKAWLR